MGSSLAGNTSYALGQARANLGILIGISMYA